MPQPSGVEAMMAKDEASFGPVTVAASADIVFVGPPRAGDVLVAEAVRGRSHQLDPAS